MKFSTLIFSLVILSGFSLTNPNGVEVPSTRFYNDVDLVKQDTLPSSFAELDLSQTTAKAIQPSGSTSISSVALSSQGSASYRSDFKTWVLPSNGGSGITVNLNMSKPSMVQLAMEVASVTVLKVANSSLNILVGGVQVNQVPISITNANWHQVVFEISSDLLQKGANSIQLTLPNSSKTPLFVRSVKFLPQKIYSSNGTLHTTIYTQFGETNQVTGVPAPAANNQIWTRAYGLDTDVEMIPGPTLYFKPGDLVSVDLVNLLNPENNEVLNKYDSINEANVNPDEVLANDSVRGEINIPHNLNNTNLHVHGLHVDPSKDDVTIVIVPQGVDTAGYDAPHTHKPVSTLDSLNEYSVADQGVKPGAWDYQYKIPKIHLPGTHWFHPHKHGSTSAQVENGLAGTIVIQEADSSAIVPFPNKANSVHGGGNQSAYDLESWQDEHDRVLAIQEITNFGAQFGDGNGKGGQVANPKNQIDITVNGKDSLVIGMQPNQLERWRLVNAGTNHRAFSHIWLGKDTGKKDDCNNNAPIFESVNMFLVAVDGITLPAKDTVSASNPALLAPGNRSDFLVQLPDAGNYVLFKNYQFQTAGALSIQDGNGKIVYRSNDPNTTFAPAIANAKNNPYLFDNTGTTPDNYGGFTQNWNGSLGESVVPLIKTKPGTSSDFIDVDFPVTSAFKKGSVSGWQPALIQGAGQISDAELVYINVSGSAVSGSQTPSMPNDTYLASIAPTTSGKAPSYVSPLSNKDVLQSRPVIFDVSGVSVKVTNTTTKKSQGVNQFTLNGRFFALNDPIGNPGADKIIKSAKTSPSDIEYGPDKTKIPQALQFQTSGGVQWGTNKVGNQYYFMNPGYYQPLALADNGAFSYNATGSPAPSWEKLTGIKNVGGKPQPAVVNTTATQYAANKGIAPSLPIAKTGEEWILINNSDVSHPFHIHINPFFVVEVGQLSYEQFADKSEFIVRAVTAPGYPQRPKLTRNSSNTGNKENAPTAGTVYQSEINVDGIVGNWWDTIIIPAHGYVKVRYWFNVPNQTDTNNVISVADNFNKTGIWVYHCHILRHEDRGMMMPVVTQKNATKEDEEEE